MNKENEEKKVIEPEPPAGEIVVRKLAPLFVETMPKETLAKVQELASALMEVIKSSKKELIVNIQGRDFMIYEGWQFLGAACNVAVSTDEPVEIKDEEDKVIGYRCKARVLHCQTGKEISSASAMITRREKAIAEAKTEIPDFQLYSKVQTRAGSKALRMMLSHIVVLAGVEPTPAEEMESTPVYPHRATVVQKDKRLQPKPGNLEF